MPSALKCRMKLPGHGIWETMGASGTLGYVEFSEVVGGDLEVPPDEHFEVEKRSSQSCGESGERSMKSTEFDVEFKLTFTTFKHHTTY